MKKPTWGFKIIASIMGIWFLSGCCDHIALITKLDPCYEYYDNLGHIADPVSVCIDKDCQMKIPLDSCGRPILDLPRRHCLLC